MKMKKSFHQTIAKKSILSAISSVQFGSRWYSCAQERPYVFPSEVSPSMPLKQFQCHSERHWPVSSLWGGSSSASSFHASFLQAVDGVMSLALCLQVASQAPRHFRSSEIQTTCNGCFAHWSVYLITSLDSSLSTTVLPTRVFSKVDVKHCNMPVCTS